MASCMYYFEPKNPWLMMAHYDPELYPSFFWGQEDFLNDTTKKNQQGFAIINIYVKPKPK